MIKLDKKTQQDFLNRKWVQELLNAGVDMSDAKYFICKHLESTELKGDFIYYKTDIKNNDYIIDSIPTYTLSELIYKVHEWINLTVDGIKYAGGLKFCKDAPFYIWYYDLICIEDRVTLTKSNYISAQAEYPIESLAAFLIECHNKGVGDVGDISNK